MTVTLDVFSFMLVYTSEYDLRELYSKGPGSSFFIKDMQEISIGRSSARSWHDATRQIKM